MKPSTPPFIQPVVIDASVWVSRILVTDTNHIAARNWIGRHLKGRGTLIAPTLFEIEVAAAVARVTQDKELARKQIAQVRRLNTKGVIRFVAASDPQFIRACVDLAIKQSLRAADATYATIAKSLGLPLVTFDAELLALPASTLQTVRPR
jgi:predicted nucleic acid-binding protein